MLHDKDIERIHAIVNEKYGDDDYLEVTTSDGEPEPPELSGGLTPDPIPVRVGGRTKRRFETRSTRYR